MRFLILLLLITSCERKPYYSKETFFECLPEQAAKIMKETQVCVKHAGVGGESEPEDWLDDCGKLIKGILCKSITRRVCVHNCIEGNSNEQD